MHPLFYIKIGIKNCINIKQGTTQKKSLLKVNIVNAL